MHGVATLVFLAGLVQAKIHVLTYADSVTEDLCYLAASTESAGAGLHVIGLSRSRQLPWERELEPQIEDGQHDVFIKTMWLMWEAMKRFPEDDLVVYVDAFDVLFQRPVAYISATYERLARASLERRGAAEKKEEYARRDWPVLFAGTKQCHPFMSGQIRPDILSADRLSGGGSYHGERRYACGDSDKTILGREVCDALQSRSARRDLFASGSSESKFIFPTPGNYVGPVGAVRRVLGHLLALHRASFEMDNQALLAIMLLCNRSEGIIDTAAEIFYDLSDFHETDVERPLCEDGYFETDGNMKDHLAAGRPPHVYGRWDKQNPTIPAVIHFSGKFSKAIHRDRCLRYFRSRGLLETSVLMSDRQASNCTYLDEDEGKYKVIRDLRTTGRKRKRTLTPGAEFSFDPLLFR